MFIADLVALKDGQPIVLVEAKGRPIRADLRDAVTAQLREYAARSGSKWVILADPLTVRLLDRNLNPVAEVPTAEVMRSAGTIDHEDAPPGERVLVHAIDIWLQQLGDNPERNLLEFAKEIRDADEIRMEYMIA